MIFDGFDNVNVTLRMSPKELKVLYHALESVGQQEQHQIALKMREKNFTEFGSKEVFAVLKQFQLTVGIFTEALERPKVVEELPDMETHPLVQ